MILLEDLRGDLRIGHRPMAQEATFCTRCGALCRWSFGDISDESWIAGRPGSLLRTFNERGIRPVERCYYCKMLFTPDRVLLDPYGTLDERKKEDW